MTRSWGRRRSPLLLLYYQLVRPERTLLADHDPATVEVLLQARRDPLGFIRRVERD